MAEPPMQDGILNDPLRLFHRTLIVAESSIGRNEILDRVCFRELDG